MSNADNRTRPEKLKPKATRDPAPDTPETESPAESAAPAEVVPVATPKPHPCNVGIKTALDMVAGGQPPEAAADWLSRNYPQHFAGLVDARNAMEAETVRAAKPAEVVPVS